MKGPQQTLYYTLKCINPDENEDPASQGQWLLQLLELLFTYQLQAIYALQTIIKYHLMCNLLFGTTHFLLAARMFSRISGRSPFLNELFTK